MRRGGDPTYVGGIETASAIRAKVKKRLANGDIKIHYYAWRGGPAIQAKPGTPEFVRAYNDAHNSVRQPRAGTLMTIIAEYKAAPEFTRLAPTTRRAYLIYIKLIEDAFGDLPLAALVDRRVRGEFKTWRDSFADTPRKADYAWTTLARIMSFAKDRGMIATNPCEKCGRLYAADRTDKVWGEQEIAALLAVATNEIKLALVLELWTGQRQGDLLRLPWSAYDGSHVRFRQSKTGRRVTMPAGAPVKVLLDGTERAQPADPDELIRSCLDLGWVSDILVKGLRPRRCHRPDVPRPRRVGCGAFGACRGDGAADRDLHRPQPQGRRSDPRCSLSRP